MTADSNKHASAIEMLEDLDYDGDRDRLEKSFDQQEEWAHMYRNKIATRGQNTNDFSEATIQNPKGIILSWMKAFNAIAFYL